MTTTTVAPGTRKKSGGCGCGGRCGGDCGGDCGCHDCRGGRLERPRWYSGQVVSPSDLILEHDYFRRKMRNHNVFMHGWGVVCGAKVTPTLAKNAQGNSTAVPYSVTIGQGYILGPYGDEILIDASRTIDLRNPTTSVTTGDPAGARVDPDCGDIQSPYLPAVVFVAVRYAECQARPVRAQPMGCDCQTTRCEHSRWRDGYEFGVLTCCPEGTPDCNEENHPAMPISAAVENWRVSQPQAEGPSCAPWTVCLPNGLPCLDCPPCPSSPWVVLAKIVTERGYIQEGGIDNCSCRRIVPSLANMVFRCAPEAPKLVAPVPENVEEIEEPAAKVATSKTKK